MNEDQIRELTETTSRSKSNTKRLDRLEEQYQLLREMSNNLAVIAEQTKNTKEDVQELNQKVENITSKPTPYLTKEDIQDLKKDVDDIKAKPDRFLDNIKAAVAVAVVTGIVGALMALVI